MIYFGKGVDGFGDWGIVGATYGSLALVRVLNNGTKTSDDITCI